MTTKFERICRAYMPRLINDLGITALAAAAVLATVAGAFRTEGGIITDYGDTIPGAGVGKIGDMRMMRTPVALGNRGWVKTSGGWKTFGVIAA